MTQDSPRDADGALGGLRRWVAGRSQPRPPIEVASGSSADPTSSGIGGGAPDGLDVTLRWPVEDSAKPRADDDASLSVGPAPVSEGSAARVHDVHDPLDLLPAVPLLPALAGRVDALDGQLRGLAMRLEMLASTTASIRTAIGERIDSYAEASATTARRVEEADEEHRRATERALNELRRDADAQAELLQRVVGRMEDVSADLAALRGAARQQPPTGARDSEQLRNVAAAVEALQEQLAVAAPPVPDLSGVEARLEALQGQLAATAPSLPDLSGIAARLDRLDERLDSVEPACPSVELAAVLGRISALEANLERVLTLVETIVDVMPASAEGSGADLAERIADAVASRLERR